MSVSDQLQQLQSLSTRFLKSMVDTPLRQLFGRHHSVRHLPGSSPGTLFISPDAEATELSLRVISEQGVQTVNQPGMDEIRQALESGRSLWLDVAGFADDDLLRALGELFELHPLTLADLVNSHRQTKVDALEEHSLIIMQVLNWSDDDTESGLTQLGMVLMGQVLLTFREHPGGLFDPVLARMDRPASRLRSEPPDYLALALLGVAVDASFPVIETLADQVDQIEDRIMDGRGHGVMNEIHRQRRALISLGRLFWRQRDLMGRLLRDDSIFRREMHIYLRDIHDRTVQLLDMIETSRELAASLVEIHLSISANRSNQIMKTLTIMASIFIPLTFIAGVYGMNFEWMPELTWAWGYPAVLLLMFSVSAGLLLWFRRRGWLGGNDD
jgi:magnesium transporter